MIGEVERVVATVVDDLIRKVETAAYRECEACIKEGFRLDAGEETRREAIRVRRRYPNMKVPLPAEKDHRLQLLKQESGMRLMHWYEDRLLRVHALFKWAGHYDPLVRKSAQALISEFPDPLLAKRDQMPKEVEKCIALGLLDKWGDVHRVLGAQAQAPLQAVRLFYKTCCFHAEFSAKVTPDTVAASVARSIRDGILPQGSHPKSVAWFDTAKRHYNNNVMSKINQAFEDNPKQPCVNPLVEAALFHYDVLGSGNKSVKAALEELEVHLHARFLMAKASCEKMSGRVLEYGKKQIRESEQRYDRCWKSWQLLKTPPDRIVKKFGKLWPRPLNAAAAAPPGAPAAAATEFLCANIEAVTGCEKCATARDPDSDARALFTSEFVRGGSPNTIVSRKRACARIDHCIKQMDLVALLGDFERQTGQRVPEKDKFAKEFMSSQFGVQPLGPPPEHKVVLFRQEATTVGVTLTVSGTAVAAGVAPSPRFASAGSAKRVFMGFRKRPREE